MAVFDQRAFLAHRTHWQMRQTTGTRTSPGEKIVKDTKRATRKHDTSEKKIRIVLDGLHGEDSISELCCAAERYIAGRQLQVVEGLHGSWKTTVGWEYGARRYD